MERPSTGGRLGGKVCIITGGAGSIGMAAARIFLSEGARVLLVDLEEVSLQKSVTSLNTANAAFVTADVSKAGDVKAYVEFAADRWGGIDVVFSNAGTLGAIAPLAAYPVDVFEQVFRVHVLGAFLACKFAAPRMRDGGSIIITSSVAGLRGDPGPYGYITAKHAQIGLMRSVAKELAPRRIRVNTLHPGPTDNAFQTGVERHLSKVLGRDATRFFDELIPLGRHAHPDEIARAALFLASDDSTFTTGSLLIVDGGMSA